MLHMVISYAIRRLLQILQNFFDTIVIADVDCHD